MLFSCLPIQMLSSANININKLDSAFDIDPLFHKMSKTFDEGGAKGLLLVNLGTGTQGCNIVFDSSKDNHEGEPHDQPHRNNNTRRPEGLVDITGLQAKLQSLLQESGEPFLEDLPLVPQLSSLRAQYSSLEEQGFGTASHASTLGSANANQNRRRSQRYAADPQDETLADRSIHQEALERSIRGRINSSSNGMGSLAIMDDDDEDEEDDGHDNRDRELLGQEYAADDFGGDENDDDFGGGRASFDNLLGVPATTPRFSAVSDSHPPPWFADDYEEEPTQTATAVLLDTLASSTHLLAAQSDYEFVNMHALSQIMSNHNSNNLWAGALHWKGRAAAKKTSPAEPSTVVPSTGKSAKKKGGKKTSPERAFVRLPTDGKDRPDFADVLKRVPKRSTLQLSKAVLTKHRKNNNLLPLDAELKVDEFDKLFMLPQLKVMGTAKASRNHSNGMSSGAKTVGFKAVIEMWDDGNAGSNGDYDDDNDGPGYFMAGNDYADDDNDDVDSVICPLDDVRKVEKVQVGYATVAKKVDVKRLKRDLWTELESHHFGCLTTEGEHATDENDETERDRRGKKDDIDHQQSTAATDPPTRISCQELVASMEQSKSQPDVTFPFYFICILHLANEKGLRLDSKGLDDFDIVDEGAISGQLW